MKAMAMRFRLCTAACWLSTSFWMGSAWAGAQVEEPLANSVRTALSAAVNKAAPPEPVFADDAQREQFEAWISAAEQRLTKRHDQELIRRDLLQTIWYEAKRAGLDPTLVLGLVEVESGFRQHAISSAGARGLMQVMPFWARTIGGGDATVLFHRQTNIRFGCVILRHYLDIEKGNVYMALGRYNGSRGRAEYPNAVTAAWRKWQSVTTQVQAQDSKATQAPARVAQAGQAQQLRAR
jgi:soluble lytic murein transglycosylase-like protein